MLAPIGTTMESQVPEGKATPASTATSGGSGSLGAHLGGARADFVASLGRVVRDARVLLTALEAEPGSPAAKGDLRAKLTLLGTGARLLGFDVITRTLLDADGVFERAAEGEVPASDLANLTQILDDLPSLAWGEIPSAAPLLAAEAPPGEDADPDVPAPLRRCALIFGGDLLAEALTDEAYGGVPFECERTEHVQVALVLARSLAPDVVLVDGDVREALDLVEGLLDDPLTEPTPILVIGSFAGAPEQAARYVALGVARTISKPTSPEALRQAADEAISQREGLTTRISLGEPTLEQLGERLAEEVRRALVESVDLKGRGCRVPLGEGTEVLGAIWGAIARVREVVTARTDGAVRFANRGPEGATALAPWLHPDVARGDRDLSRGRGPAVDVKLTGRRVVVADDDPGVTWFIADLLKTAGCTVYEALDGQTALELAYEHSPELVVSDILMPELDGFALCRALRRDVALRDVPVVLLSWKEDLLQRVRELGASAAAYLRKESDSRAIVARVREVLRPRTRIEARLKSGGEVHGRLDGLTVHSLLSLVCALRPNSRISVRDASFLYEMEVRFGSPQRATRTSGDGSFLRGSPVITGMLGVGAGRFTVADSTGSIRGELEGNLADQLAQPLAYARGALHSVTGARIMGAERVLLDEQVLDAYLRATPEPARALIRKIAAGTAPRDVLLSGEVDPGLLEDVLSDLASRGAVAAVLGSDGVDLLGPAISWATAVMDGEHRRHPSSAASMRARRPSMPPSVGKQKSQSAASVGVKAAEPGPEPRVERSPVFSGAPTPSPVEKTDVDTTVYEENPEASIPIAMETSEPAPAATKEQAGLTAPSKSRQQPERERESSMTPLASVTVAEARKPQRQLWQYAAIVAGAAVVVWMALRMSTPATPPEPEARSASGAPTAETAESPPKVTFAEIAPGVDVPPGQGLLEVTAPPTVEIRVDDVPRGHGPVVRVALVAGNHEVRLGADAKRRVLEVRAGRTTRVEVSQVP